MEMYVERSGKSGFNLYSDSNSKQQINSTDEQTTSADIKYNEVDNKLIEKKV